MPDAFARVGCCRAQAYAYRLVKWKWFERFILFVILLNTVFLSLDSPTLVRPTPWCF